MRHLFLVPTEMELTHLAGPLDHNHHRGFHVRKDETGVWAICGIGPASAMTTALMIRALDPERIILLGIGGAYPQSEFKTGDLVQARSEVYGDLGFRKEDRYVNLDEMKLPLLQMAGGFLACHYALAPLDKALPDADFVTLACITNSKERADVLYNTYHAAVENMEGACVAMACAQAGIPCHQIRAVSNMVGPRDPAKWQIEEPLKKLGQWVREFCTP
ncbi:MAG: futalosine hydrolase [Acidobacteriota bacterium]|nr:futalosine hydrolase [Acidobacteriota bacterium]